MKFRNLWLFANFVGFFYGIYLSISHPENVTGVFMALQSLTIGTYIAIHTYKALALLMAAASILGAFCAGYLAGGEKNEKPKTFMLLPAILLAIAGVNALFYPTGFRLVLEYFGFIYVALGLAMINIGSMYWLIHDIEESPKVRRKLRLSFT